MNRLKKHPLFLLLTLMLLSMFITETSYSQTANRKLAQTSFKFLTISLDARAAAMADAMTAQEASSTALFYNPASMAWMEDRISVGLGMTQWIADVNYNSASAAFRTPFGVFGVSGTMVDYGDFLGTIRADNDDGFVDTQTYSPTAMAFGLGYARALTARFSVGGQVKYVAQDLGSAPLRYDENENLVYEGYDQNAFAFDFGVFYDTGFNGMKLAMSFRNFSRELTYVEENFELPLQFRIGLSMDLINLTQINPSTHSLLLSIDTERPRDYFEQVKVGAEYTFLNTFAIRGGIIAPHDEQGVNMGFGIKDLAGFDLDYSYTDFGIFDGVNRFSLKFGF